jgi:hypothetical protein
VTKNRNEIAFPDIQIQIVDRAVHFLYILLLISSYVIEDQLGRLDNAHFVLSFLLTGCKMVIHSVFHFT